MWALAGSDTEFIHLFQLPYVLIVCIPVTWLMVQGDLNCHITVTCTLLGSAAVVAVVYRGPPAAACPAGSGFMLTVLSGTELRQLSLAFANHLLFTSASAIQETPNQMVVATEIAFKVCEPQRGVPSFGGLQIF